MKKIATLAAAGLVSFIAGLAGLYFAMPYIQPDKAEAVRAELDSLRAVIAADSLLVADVENAPIEIDLVLADTTVADSVAPVLIPIDEHPRFLALSDSLTRVAAAADVAEADRARLLERIGELERAGTARTVALQDVSELAATLTRLEENELRPILDRLDDTTVARLYDQATGRNRTKILRSMQADRAARLVQRMVGRPVTQPAAPATVTSHSEAESP